MVKMNKSLLCVLLISLLLALAGSAGLSVAQEPDPPDREVGAQADVGIAAYISSPAMSYQGRLTEDSSPVDGTKSMTFRLCTAEIGGTTIWTEGPKSVDVTNGLFHVTLGDTAAMNVQNLDQALWLEIEVEGTKLPRQKLLGAPYAFSLAPGANVSGNSTSSMLYVYNAGSGVGVQGYGVNSNGVYGESGSTYAGVYGRSINGLGVYGYSNNGDGVQGFSNNGTGLRATSVYTHGVVAKSTFGMQGTHGVYGETNGNHGWASGVYGKASQGNAIGVTGWNTGSGVGVYAYSQSGPVVVAKGDSGNLIEAWDTDPGNLRFYVQNDGDVYADRAYWDWGADVADMMPVAGDATQYEPGDVLAIGPDGMLILAQTPYATNVAGVYSTQPGFVGGAGDDESTHGKIPLALVGVVPVKASVENGPIAPGDLLVASATPGHAMRAGPNPPVGTVVGKGLEALEEGTSVIQMLAVLQ